MASLEVPIISVVIGEGGSGGALALGVADRILMLEYSIYSVISPEGCASILWRDPAKVPEAATQLKLTATDLVELGVCDEIIPEAPGGAHRDLAVTAAKLRIALKRHLRELTALSPGELIERRYQKFRAMGAFVESAAHSTMLYELVLLSVAIMATSWGAMLLRRRAAPTFAWTLIATAVAGWIAYAGSPDRRPAARSARSARSRSAPASSCWSSGPTVRQAARWAVATDRLRLAPALIEVARVLQPGTGDGDQATLAALREVRSGEIDGAVEALRRARGQAPTELHRAFDERITLLYVVAMRWEDAVDHAESTLFDLAAADPGRRRAAADEPEAAADEPRPPTSRWPRPPPPTPPGPAAAPATSPASSACRRRSGSSCAPPTAASARSTAPPRWRSASSAPPPASRAWPGWSTAPTSSSSPPPAGSTPSAACSIAAPPPTSARRRGCTGRGWPPSAPATSTGARAAYRAALGHARRRAPGQGRDPALPRRPRRHDPGAAVARGRPHRRRPRRRGRRPAAAAAPPGRPRHHRA